MDINRFKNTDLTEKHRIKVKTFRHFFICVLKSNYKKSIMWNDLSDFEKVDRG